MMELSTPVVQLWDKILALPLIGTLDSVRAQMVMENLLQAIVERGAEFAIVDITGVPTVDTLVAQHLLKTARSEEHTSELQSLMRISYAVFCLKKQKQNNIHER